MKQLLITLFITIHASVFSQSIKNKVDSIAREYQAVGVAYVVVKDGQIVHSDAVGYKDLEQKVKLSATDDLFRIASISKSFTATALMKLVEDKRLSLDDDFGKLVGFPVRNPQFPDKVITLRMVLSHTSSINDKNGYFNLDAINPNKNPEWAKGYNTYEPGTGYAYCNLNFNMAGAALERAVGVRFDSYIKAKILTPLGLKAGYCIDSLNQESFAKIYEYDSTTARFEPQPAAYAARSEEIKKYELGHKTPVFSPTGGMKISAKDLAKYMIMHMNYGQLDTIKILEKQSAKIMQTPVNKEAAYGLALHVNRNFVTNSVMVGHTGSAYGLYSAMFFEPQERFGIVVITNGCRPKSQDDEPKILKEIANCLYDHLVK
ncbi:CubicO group peptidase, beta-lactamase class C family [Sphingobacterium nematocida]|uniref:CubicO group peptidase, beta-lactamase class C family n=1 Tax=Sphingobacterium nematocida TaxID=1513896 RepID=A0A1T5EHX3_9SPHI|nr:serine hydrolase domain-containing protein [Sphingobacterium nematocida]SKB83405.1 CubicO group peptidase, beta-lactamase class C family [Sphingobacterium nematocida]